VLTATRLTRRFGSRPAVEDVSFDLRPGEIFALLGPNGAGKTTTLRMLAGLIQPSSGDVRMDGEPLSKRSGSRLRGRIGFLTEAPGLWDRLTVGTNLLVYARLQDVPRPEAAVDAALELFDLRGRKHERAAQLSKGLRQRVALARTLLHHPDIVLLDEPTSGLDPESAREVRDLILRLREQRRAVLLSTHNLDEAQRVADRVAVLRTRLVALDTPAALRARLFGARVLVTVTAGADRFAEVLKPHFTDIRVVDRTLSIGVDNVEQRAPAIVAALVEAGAGVVSVTGEEPPLEEIYLALLQKESR